MDAPPSSSGISPRTITHSITDSPSHSSSFDSQRSVALPINGHAESFLLAVGESIPCVESTRQRKTSLTFINGLALVLGLQIGSGIFSAPSQVSNHVISPGVAVSVWLLAGLLVCTGATSFIELGLAIPKNGGIQEYLRVCYGEFPAFLFSWVWMMIAKPCAMAIIAMVFAENLGAAVTPTGNISEWKIKAVALAGLYLITSINCLGTAAGTRAANAFLLLKLLAVASIVVIGIAVNLMHGSAYRKVVWFGKDPDPQRQALSSWEMIGNYITAIYGALFCYGGWETIGFVAGDMANSSRDLPRVIYTAMCVAVSGFVLLNIALFSVLPFQLIRDRSVVAVDFGLQIFGTSGALIYSLVVSASCLGALNANVFTTGRLCVAASESHFFPRILGNGHCSTREGDSLSTRKALKRFPTIIVAALIWFAERTEALRWDKQVPVYAMMMNAFIVSFYIIVGTFNSLVTFIGLSEYSFFVLAVLGVFLLRRRRINYDTPFKTWTSQPIIFCTFSTFLVVRGVITSPFQGALILFFTLVGWVIFKSKFTQNHE